MQKKKYPHLKSNSKRIRRVLKDFIDFDYIDKLSDKDKDFLDKFVREEYTADFRDSPKVSVKKKREIYRTNNRRNRDTYGIIKSIGRMSFGDVQAGFDGSRITANMSDGIDGLIDENLRKQRLDLKKRKNKSRKSNKKK